MDRREDILERIKAIIEAMPGYTTKGRNLIALPVTALPAIHLQDGPEAAVEFEGDARRSQLRGQKIEMQPAIVVELKAGPETSGPVISAKRAEVIKALKTDAALTALTWNKDGVAYLGSEPIITLDGGALAGVVIQFNIPYQLFPEQL